MNLSEHPVRDIAADILKCLPVGMAPRLEALVAAQNSTVTDEIIRAIEAHLCKQSKANILAIAREADVLGHSEA
ncbi:hypothetical protein Pstr01_22100 [Pseudomonas straminea]|uniref:Uncharacterized protein n=1 Tax=Pseudomonas straminea TaxID=47882 RepID=A0A1I1UFA9_PSEOC|nr:hypothetical protein [Pseudomonas straminea]GLX13971.1 hypothetical protein Pstr01_22100 [Pseudomonas straminea]SFD67453.1 hypothetical protein SAMN05216372_103170 [Pseudomonas straminea]